MQCVYSAPNSMLVDNLKNVLEGEEIECIVKNRQLAGAVGEVPPIEAWLELWVLKDEEVERAQALVDEALDDSTAAAAWRCATCGEQIPGELGACWKCSEPPAQGPGRDPLPGGLLYRALWRRLGSGEAFSWIAIAAMLLALLVLLSFSRAAPW